MEPHQPILLVVVFRGQGCVLRLLVLPPGRTREMLDTNFGPPLPFLAAQAAGRQTQGLAVPEAAAREGVAAAVAVAAQQVVWADAAVTGLS